MVATLGGKAPPDRTCVPQAGHGAALLITALTSDHSEVRWRAAALGQIGDPAALPALAWMRQHNAAETSFDGSKRAGPHLANTDL